MTDKKQCIGKDANGDPCPNPVASNRSAECGSCYGKRYRAELREQAAPTGADTSSLAAMVKAERKRGKQLDTLIALKQANIEREQQLQQLIEQELSIHANTTGEQPANNGVTNQAKHTQHLSLIHI